MTRTELFPEISARVEELYKCVNCGLCQAVCPTYLERGYEGLTARGKIMLMRGMLEGSVEPTASVANLFDNCLTCYACQTVCPAGVKTERLWAAARQDLSGRSWRSGLKRVGLGWSIGKPALFERELRVAAWAKRRLGAELYGMSGEAPYVSRLEQEYPAHRSEIGSVALLAGCSSNIFAPWVLDATIHSLRAAGYRVIVPKEQVCCGAPAINNGAWEIARKLAIRNLELFSNLKADHITSPDGTCANALRLDYIELFQGQDDHLRDAKAVSGKVRDLSVLLNWSREKGVLKFRKMAQSVTLHDSCHVTHVGGGNRWRALLETVEGLELVEMKNSQLCCGFGGSYNAFHKRGSEAIARSKIENASATGANTVLVGSPGCVLRLHSALKNLNTPDMEVRHAVEIIAEAAV